nr:hypothetical protein CFP56_44597 [Quercus suber]
MGLQASLPDPGRALTVRESGYPGCRRESGGEMVVVDESGGGSVKVGTEICNLCGTVYQRKRDLKQHRQITRRKRTAPRLHLHGNKAGVEASEQPLETQAIDQRQGDEGIDEKSKGGEEKEPLVIVKDAAEAKEGEAKAKETEPKDKKTDPKAKDSITSKPSQSVNPPAPKTKT